MGAQGIVVQPGQDPVPPSASFSLKLRCKDTGGSIMVLRRRLPAGKKHVPRTSRQQRGGYGLSGEVTFKIGDEVTVGPRRLRLHAAQRAACLEDHRHGNRARPRSLCSGKGGRVDRRAQRTGRKFALMSEGELADILPVKWTRLSCRTLPPTPSVSSVTCWHRTWATSCGRWRCPRRRRRGR